MLSTAGTLPKVSSTGSGLNLGGALPNHGQLTHGSMTLGSPRTSNLSVQYSAEADLVLGQTAMLVQLMQMTAVAGQGSNSTWSADDLQAARLLLCVQVSRPLVGWNSSPSCRSAQGARMLQVVAYSCSHLCPR